MIKYTKNPKPMDGIDFFLEEELKKKSEESKEETKTEEPEINNVIKEEE